MLPTVSRATAAIALAALSACGGERVPGGPRSALLITLDTTRADALSCFGGPPGVTPRIDALAAESVRYTAARSVTPLTLPAHASMFTGLYPPRTGVRNNGPVPLPRAAITLAERAQAGGVQTAAFVAAAALDRAFGLDQGFAVYDQPEVAGPRGEPERGAAETVAAARAWLAARDRAHPFLLWVHLFDAHHPYLPPPTYLAQAGGDVYRGEVAAMDAAVGALLDDLRAEGVLDGAAVIVVADHGEGLGDHGEETHGLFCFDTTLLVPLLVRHPDGDRAGETSGEIASVADVYPTLLEAMRLGAPGDTDGLSLWSSPVPADRGVYFESYLGWSSFGWSPLAGWADRDGKYLHSPAPTLHRPGADESAPTPAGADGERYRAAIAALLQRPALPTDGHALVDEGTMALVAALGYTTTDDWTTAAPHPLEPGGRPNPLERRAELDAYWRATELVAQDRRADAKPLLEGIFAENPANVQALDLLAEVLIAGGEHDRAAEVLRERLRHPPERIRTHDRLATCYEVLTDRERAKLHRRRALELLLLAHTRRGEHREADRVRVLIRATE